MKLLISFLKFLQSLCLLLIPMLIFYCILSSMQAALIDQYQKELGTLLSPVSMIVNIFDQILGPFVNMFKGLVDFEITFNNTKLEFTHFVAAAALFCSYHVLGMVNNFLLLLVQKSKELKKINAQRKAELILEQKMLDEVSKYKMYSSTAIVLKIKKTESNINYLVENKNVALKADNDLQEILTLVSSCSGKIYNDHSNEDYYHISFKHILNAINFCFELREKLNDLNEINLKTGNKFTYYIFAENFIDKTNKSNDFIEIEKLFYLTGENEIYVGEVFKKYYECFTTDFNYKFISKGLYSIGKNNELEIFSLVKIK